MTPSRPRLSFSRGIEEHVIFVYYNRKNKRTVETLTKEEFFRLSQNVIDVLQSFTAELNRPDPPA